MNKLIIICCIVLFPSLLRGQLSKHPDIGDTIPTMKIENVINCNNNEIELPLKNDKAVIIDFWGRYCAPCILALGKLDSLQKLFKNDLEIITVSDFANKEEALKTLNRYNVTKNLSLPLVLNDSALKEIFPYKFVSHVVWINKQGVVQGFTGTEYVNEQNINKLVKGEKLNLPVKTDALDFDYKKPLLFFSQPDMINPEFFYYTTLTGCIDGISPPLGLYRDSITNSTFIILSNQSFLNLAKVAGNGSAGARRDQFVFHVKDVARYIQPKNKITYTEWRKDNTYTYYARLPLSIIEEDAWQFVQNDLQKWLGLMGITVKKETRVKVGKKEDVYIITEKDFSKRRFDIPVNASQQ